MRSHEIDYKIIGNDCQLVEIELDQNETVIAEAGAMLFMEQGIDFETKMGDGSNPNQGFFGKLMQAGTRLLTGESLFMTHFTNRMPGKSRVSFSAPYPGTILPIDLQKMGGTLICQKDAFLCAALGTKVSIQFNKKIGAGLFGGEGFILEKLEGDGMAFIHAGGTVIERYLNNETIRIDTGCIVAYEPQMYFDIQSAGGLKSMMFGGEGMFLATLSGTGRVWLQSMPIRNLVKALSPGGANSRKESGGLFGGGLFE
jgi:uncharacterized protein (TIGR00266 family)